MRTSQPARRPAHPFRVFLVEDDDDHAELTTFHLQQHAPDVAVERAKDGEEAVTRLLDFMSGAREERPTVVLLDLKLPKLDGIGVLKRLAAEVTATPIPIVMLSTSNADRDKLEAYRAHVNSYLVKPSEFEEFQGLMGDFVHYWRDRNQQPEGP